LEQRPGRLDCWRLLTAESDANIDELSVELQQVRRIVQRNEAEAEGSMSNFDTAKNK